MGQASPAALASLMLDQLPYATPAHIFAAAPEGPAGCGAPELLRVLDLCSGAGVLLAEAGRRLVAALLLGVPPGAPRREAAQLAAEAVAGALWAIDVEPLAAVATVLA